MTQKDKSLLLKDLCGRLYCGVICQIYDNKYGYKLLGIDDDELHIDCPVYDEGDGYVEIDYCKPYLRSMSSMTEEERKEVEILIKENRPSPYGKINNKGMDNLFSSVAVTSSILIDWLNAHYFDYRSLIPKGLAIEAPEGMY